MGHEFVKFLPHAIGIKAFLALALAHGGLLQGFMVGFTVIEGLVGLALLLGLGTRTAALGIVLLSLGILLGSGWLGSTCLDEWQIGVLGVAAGILLVMTGSGAWSLDWFWQTRFPRSAPSAWMSSGALGAGQPRGFRPAALLLAALCLGLTLATNQIFYGGLWGRLHNDSKVPHFTLTEGRIGAAGSIGLTLYRDGGPDTYGAFITAIRVRNAAGEVKEQFEPAALKALPPGSIRNAYALKVGPGPCGLVAPLGSRAALDLVPGRAETLPEGAYTLEVEDVSGLKWRTPAVWSN